MGNGGRAFGMIVLAAAVLAGVGWGVDALVERVEEELPGRAPEDFRPLPRQQPRSQRDIDQERALHEALAAAQADARRNLEEARMTDPADPQPQRAGGEVSRPVAIHQPAPAYTEAARRAGVQGVVILEAEIDTEGRVTATRVLKGLPMGLDEEARKAVAQWRFAPATRNGEPVRVAFVVTINFRLE